LYALLNPSEANPNPRNEAGKLPKVTIKGNIPELNDEQQKKRFGPFIAPAIQKLQVYYDQLCEDPHLAKEKVEKSSKGTGVYVLS